ncbi:MAG: methyltransferase domain-containing protein [Paracoccus sp. (in: a-proteobacteria)]
MSDESPEEPDFIPELLALMPISVRDVLICDGPALARAYRAKNPTARITAIGAADHDAVDAVVKGTVETLPKSRLGGPFDLVVVNETLGRLQGPVRLLDRLAARLKPGGHLVMSCLNEAHWSRIRMRLEGQAVPRDALAYEAARELISAAGLVVRRVRGKRQEQPDEAQPLIEGLLRAGQAGGMAEAALKTRLATTHYVVVAMRPVAGARPPAQARIHQVELAQLMDVRTRLPAEALAAEPALQLTTAFKRHDVPDLGPEGGIVILQRPRMSDPRRLVEYVAACQKRRILVVVEYDDDPALVARVLGRDDVPDIYQLNLGLVHAVQTSTGLLAQQFRRANPEVMAFANVAGDLPPRRVQRAGPLRVLFAALNRGRTDEMAALFAPAIAAVPEIRFEVIHDRTFFDALPSPNKHFSSLMRYRSYLDLMGRCDICLMPLEGRPEEMGKSDVKWVEAASRGAVAIASPAVYEGTIRHGENGFIVREPGDWSRLLIELAADPDLRNRIAATAHAEVREGRMMAQQVAMRRDWYLDLLARREEIFAAAIRRSPALASEISAG